MRISKKTHPDLHAPELLKVLHSRSYLYATIGGKEGPWKVLSMTMGDSDWTAEVERVEADGGPRGPTTEPRRRRG